MALDRGLLGLDDGIEQVAKGRAALCSWPAPLVDEWRYARVEQAQRCRVGEQARARAAAEVASPWGSYRPVVRGQRRGDRLPQSLEVVGARLSPAVKV